MKIIVDNLVVEYTDEGQGPTLLMLHGWMNSLHSFDAIANILSAKYRVIRLDLPGFGGSEPPPVPWNDADYANFVAHFLAKIDIAADVMVGHSFGGRILVKGVGSGILRAGKVVLIDSAGNARRDTPRVLFYKALAKTGKLFAAFVPNSWYAALRKRLYTHAGSDYAEAGALSRTFLNVIKEDLTQDARRIPVPTLLVWGEKDDTTPLDDGKRFAEVIPNAKLVVFFGAGHAPHRERPQEVAKAIETFV